jgi:hypothetical protein
MQTSTAKTLQGLVTSKHVCTRVPFLLTQAYQRGPWHRGNLMLEMMVPGVVACKQESCRSPESGSQAALLLCEFISDILELARTNRPRSVSCSLARLTLGRRLPLHAPF